MRAHFILACLAHVAYAAQTTITVPPGDVDALVRAVQEVGNGGTIVLAGGTYRLAQPIALEPRHSRVTIAAAEGQVVVISGGRAIAGWRAAKLNGRDCWAAPFDGFVRQIWIDGKRATRARSPNRGQPYFRVKESPDMTPNWEVGQSRFRFDGTDVPAGPFAAGAELIIGTRWVESRLPITSVDAVQKLVSFSRKSQWRTEPNDPYWIEGDPRFFDEAGEWFLDRAAATIYYLPLPGQAMEKVEVIAPRLTHLLEIRGEPGAKKFVEDLAIRGITFAHTGWMLPDADPATTQPASGGFMQAAVPVPAAVRAQGLRRASFENCTFRNLGTWALELGKSTQRSRVSRCNFMDLGGGGIKLGDDQIGKADHELTFANEIADCEIAHAGEVFPSAVGIWVGQAFDNRIAHNHIHDLLYSGVSVGWSWGYGDSLNRGNVVEKNHIHHIGKRSDGEGPLLADMGAIYVLGGRAGTILRNNHLHDVNGVRISWGVYLDEGCCDVLVEKNLVHHTSHGGFHLHYGRENVIRSNVFAFATHEQQIQRSREEGHLSFIFERNIVHWTNGTPMTQSGPTNVRYDHNTYSGITSDAFRAGGKTWEEWRAAGQDGNSKIAETQWDDRENVRDAGVRNR